MTKPMISVIVPIYNVQAFLPGCLESIISQTFKDIEIICIDDGSTDESGTIAESYTDKDSRIKVIHQENQGLSGARNTGMRVAEGEFIAFCDSDDYYHPEFLERLYRVIEKTGADVACCNFVKTKEKYTGAFPTLPEPHVELTYNPSMMYLKTRKISTGVDTKLYRRDAIKDLSFIKGIYFEDVPFTTALMLRIKSAVITDLPMYYYYANPNSIMRTSFSWQKVSSYIQLIRHIAKDTQEIRPDLVALVRQKVLNGRFKMMVNQAVRKQKDIEKRKELFDKMQPEVVALFREGIISYAGLKPHHRLALFLLVHCKTSTPARLVMTYL